MKLHLPALSEMMDLCHSQRIQKAESEIWDDLVRLRIRGAPANRLTGGRARPLTFMMLRHQRRMKKKRHLKNAKARVNVGECECRKGSLTQSLAKDGAREICDSATKSLFLCARPSCARVGLQ